MSSEFSDQIKFPLRRSSVARKRKVYKALTVQLPHFMDWNTEAQGAIVCDQARIETQGLLALSRAGLFGPLQSSQAHVSGLWPGVCSLITSSLLRVILMPMVYRPVPVLGMQLPAPVNGALQPGQRHPPPLGGRGPPPMSLPFPHSGVHCSVTHPPQPPGLLLSPFIAFLSLPFTTASSLFSRTQSSLSPRLLGYREPPPP